MRYILIIAHLLPVMLYETTSMARLTRGHNPLSRLEDGAQTPKEFIEEIYTNLSGFGIADTEYEMIESHGGNATYGEITYEGVQVMLKELRLTPKDVFYDLGSGVAKVPIQVYLQAELQKGAGGPRKVIGVELSPTRHRRAKKALEYLTQRKKLNRNRKIELRQENISTTDLSDATVIFMCSTCFSDRLMEALVGRFSTLNNGLRVLTLRRLPGYEKNGFSLTNEFTVDTSWATNVSIYMYTLDGKNVLDSLNKIG